MAVCPNFDNEETDPSSFFDGHSINWKRHYIGWAIAGVCALISTVISFRLLYKHARNYHKPSEQRHIMRIVLMIPIYSVISFLSYRFYKEAIYYETVRDCYEAFVIYSFFVLLLTYLGDDNKTRQSRITGSEHQKLMFPLNCYYYNPHSELFLHKMKYGVLQYVVVNPITTVASVILQYKGLYCDTSYNFAFGKVYITIIDFISVSVAMYCLVIFYLNIKTEIEEKKPFMKFLCVKLVIFFCFWQTCLLSLLGDLNVFKATEYWSVSNIEIGISALLICVEMVVFAILHVYSFGYEPYVGTYNTPVRRSLRDGFNPIDLVKEIGWACKDIAFIIMGRPLPIRDEHLSGAVKRASIIRAKNRYSSKNGSFAGGNVTPSGADPLAMTMDSPSLEAGDKFNYSDPQQQAPLLSNVDNAHTTNSYRQNTYEMKQQQQQQQQQQLQHQQVQQQQLQHQQYQQQQQQLQQQQAYLSKPADDYQY